MNIKNRCKLGLIIGLLITQTALASCFSEHTICSSTVKFLNVYKLSKVSCSAPGGPLNTSEHFQIFNSLNGKKPLITKSIDLSDENFFKVIIDTKGKVPTITIEDRSVTSDENINISTSFKPLDLNGYRCKQGWN